ncbi:hypothetical protein MMC18_005511 [Xylographa bjoerkii]|nr:hypothetical protein [Xylographa bjoerkii]
MASLNNLGSLPSPFLLPGLIPVQQPRHSHPSSSPPSSPHRCKSFGTYCIVSWGIRGVEHAIEDKRHEWGSKVEEMDIGVKDIRRSLDEFDRTARECMWVRRTLLGMAEAYCKAGKREACAESR